MHRLQPAGHFQMKPMRSLPRPLDLLHIGQPASDVTPHSQPEGGEDEAGVIKVLIEPIELARGRDARHEEVEPDDERERGRFEIRGCDRDGARPRDGMLVGSDREGADAAEGGPVGDQALMREAKGRN